MPSSPVMMGKVTQALTLAGKKIPGLHILNNCIFFSVRVRVYLWFGQFHKWRLKILSRIRRYTKKDIIDKAVNKISYIKRQAIPPQRNHCFVRSLNKWENIVFHESTTRYYTDINSSCWGMDVCLSQTYVLKGIVLSYHGTGKW